MCGACYDAAVATDSKDPEPKAFETGRDGDKIAGFYTGKDSRRNWTSSTEEAALELAAQNKKQGTILPDLPPPPRAPITGSRKWTPLIVIFAALAVPGLMLAGYRWWEARNNPAKAHGLIVIDSVPSGAVLFIDGREVGRTPYVAPNRFQPGTEVPLRIVYPGAQDYTGTIPGGVATTVTAELQAKPE